MTTSTELLSQAIQAIQAESVNADQVAAIVDERVKNFAETFEPPKGEAITAEDVRRIFAESLSTAIDAIPPKRITIDVAGAISVFKGKHLHPRFESVLRAVAAGKNVMLVGPAGSGKTTLAYCIAEAIQRVILTQGPASSEYKYLGFVDAHGNMVETPLHKAFREGHLFLAEEIDSSGATALVAGLNMVLSNREADFGNVVVPRHEDFSVIATANTWGAGADRRYVGRNKLDAATLDRFVVFHIDYDEGLERAIAQDDNWVDFVQAARKASEALEFELVISPRASIDGADLIRAGLPRKEVAESVLWRGASADQVRKIKAEIKRQKEEGEG